jgi:hypothetical protein
MFTDVYVMQFSRERNGCMCMYVCYVCTYVSFYTYVGYTKRVLSMVLS